MFLNSDWDSAEVTYWIYIGTKNDQKGKKNIYETRMNKWIIYSLHAEPSCILGFPAL